jgi:hypothetical protein
MIAAALLAVGVMLAAFGLIRLRALDIEQRRANSDFDPESALVAHIGSAVFIGLGVGLIAFGWLVR